MPRASNIARVIALIALGAVAAVLSNLTASTQRKLAWAGSYPRALDVEAPAVEPAPTASIPAPAEPTARPAGSAGSPPAVPVTAPLAPPAALEPDLAKSFPPHPDKS